ncbi:hypothetical protein TeGR_g1211 [Tetraparma gracilis]|uniref:Ubiquitin-like protease family profile domain-containing protein n=1 Tax=Tetraparma gracilis TaxID=2962635 RepID=A0ABQ6MFI3_9STRA|nr:hypothetical protein TeGR_g1211 [Tetraparma gracilis]
MLSDNGSRKFTDSDVGLKDCYDTVSEWHDDIFGYDTVVLPVCFDLHWSCVVVEKPGNVLKGLEGASITLIDSGEEMRVHAKGQLGKTVRGYLNANWMNGTPAGAPWVQREPESGSDALSLSSGAETDSASDAASMEIGDPPAVEMATAKKRKKQPMPFTYKSIAGFSAFCQQQTNDYDGGVFTAAFIEAAIGGRAVTDVDVKATREKMAREAEAVEPASAAPSAAPAPEPLTPAVLLRLREERLVVMEEQRATREEEVVVREEMLVVMEEQSASREEKLDLREKSVAAQEAKLAKLAAKKLASREKQLNVREENVARREAEVKKLAAVNGDLELTADGEDKPVASTERNSRTCTLNKQVCGGEVGTNGTSHELMLRALQLMAASMTLFLSYRSMYDKMNEADQKCFSRAHPFVSFNAAVMHTTGSTKNKDNTVCSGVSQAGFCTHAETTEVMLVEALGWAGAVTRIKAEKKVTMELNDKITVSVRICPRCQTKMMSHNMEVLALRAAKDFDRGFDDAMSDAMSDALKNMPFIAYEARDDDDGDVLDSIWFTLNGNDENVDFGIFDVKDFKTSDDALSGFDLHT